MNLYKYPQFNDKHKAIHTETWIDLPILKRQ